MKYCPHCGKAAEDDAAFCPRCGSSLTTNNTENNAYQPTQPQKTNGMCIAGFVLSFFIPIVGVILSIIGKKQAAERGEGGDGLALAGIIISILNCVLNIIYIMVIISSLISQLAAISLI